jgi:hypothetical protein
MTKEEQIDKMIELLSDRRGFDGWWEDIDEDIQNEIKEEMLSVIIEE